MKETGGRVARRTDIRPTPRVDHPTRPDTAAVGLSEADTRAKLIDPAIHRRGWTEDLIRREETAGAIEAKGRDVAEAL